uniref:GA-79-MBP, maltose binding protein n=1 Tax=Streptococcus dysgalactiae TaxID=1334 RepID=A0A0J9X1W7_STRDY|nr:Chain A, GA-79-MBP, maltose binding protein [Streptococcus dysgalactiae]
NGDKGYNGLAEAKEKAIKDLKIYGIGEHYIKLIEKAKQVAAVEDLKDEILKAHDRF